MDVFKRFRVIFLAFMILTAVLSFAEDAEQAEEDENDTKAGEDNEVREEEGVLYLTDDNFDKVTEKYDAILVEFYAPWCGHCKSLAPEYSKAAYKLKESEVPVPLGKVDATVNSDLAARFGVSGYPTLKFKKDGTWIEYDGPRDAEGIVTWVSEKADPNYKPPPETVVTVTKDNFDEFINSAELVLLEFYAPWCGHCKRLAPEYEKAAQRLILHEPPIPLGKVDATVEKELVQQFGVTGYPTLKMFRNGKPSDYTGGRDAFGIVDHMHKYSGEASKLLPELRDVKNLISKESATIIGFFDNLEDEKLRAYMNVANDRREDLTFGHTLLPEARDIYKVNPGSVVVFKPEKFYTKFEQKYSILKVADKSEEEIAAFVKENELPLVGEYTQSTSKFYDEYQKDILCVAFYTVDWSFDHRDATQLWRKKVANIAKDYKDIKFAIANEEDYINTMMKEVGLEDSPEEFNLGCVKNGKKYRMEPMDEFDEDEIREFLNKLKKGKLTPQIKSQSVPKKNTGPVKVVVGKTFDQIVLDKKKDVLIEFYAPWCGHCKSLEPIYKELGKTLKKEKNLVIAKLDATANDVPEIFKVEGFPTIYFAPANNKKNPLKFDGDRTVEGFTKYLKEKAAVSFGKNLKEEL
ncbi:protein disulfide-isomerase A4-like [Mercenaria mercenaria]|uniref:protein disulfide-isomerase A4-like n=1 Tax=Mercenaria mercenaria TaxID=6596 RepID=UPI00234E9EE4|nr:protein disulfide-isomerase A4-like [Mercenaria mercenaria]